LRYRFSSASPQHKEKIMKRATWARQFDLFNTPTRTPLSAPQAVRAEVLSLLCALLLEVVPPRQPHPITGKEEQA
jgi:hypothetical protein